MTEQELKAFTHTVLDYFKTVSDDSPEIGMPYIKDSQTEVQDYTGIIGISGNRRGGVYLTAGKALLQDFGACILGEDDLDDTALYDLIGEMTNTIAGNIRQVFGSSFLISVPIVLKGHIEEIVIRLKPPVFIIPITWRKHRCHLAIGLE